MAKLIDVLITKAHIYPISVEIFIIVNRAFANRYVVTDNGLEIADTS